MRILAILMLFACVAHGTTYYVRTDGNNANDGLSNTAGGAWQTINYAATQVTSGGHTVLVQAGTYDENVSIDSGDGSAGNYKVFRGVGDVMVPRIYLYDQYCYIDTFHITNSTISVNAFGMFLGASSDNSVITNCTFRTKCNGLYSTSTQADYVSNILVAGCVFTNCQKSIWFHGTAAGPGIKVWTNQIINPHEWTTATDVDYMRIVSGGNHEVIGNLFYGANTNEIDTTKDAPHLDHVQIFSESGDYSVTNVIVAWNIMLDSYNSIMLSGTANGNFTITNNVFGRGCPYYFVSKMQGESAFNITDGTTFTIRNNTIFGYGDHAIFSSGTDFVTMENNIYLDTEDGYVFNSGNFTADYNCTHPTLSTDAGAHDITDDPMVVNASSPLGADGLAWTADDGLRLTSNTPEVIRTGTGGKSWGAYQAGSAAVTVQNLRVDRLILR